MCFNYYIIIKIFCRQYARPSKSENHYCYLIKASFKNEDQSEKLTRLLESQSAYVNEQNKALSQKLDHAVNQIEFLNQKLQQLTKLL